MAAPRMVANEAVLTKDYTTAFLHAHSRAKLPLDEMLGSLKAAPYQISPDDLARGSPLIEELLSIGLKNGVIYPSRFEQGLRDAILENRSAMKAEGQSAELKIIQIRTHVSNLLTQLRNWKRETTGVYTKKVTKTAGLKRKASSAQQVLINTLVSKLDWSSEENASRATSVEPAGSRASSPEPPPGTEATRIHQSLRGESSSGLPLCFQKYLENLRADSRDHLYYASLHVTIPVAIPLANTQASPVPETPPAMETPHKAADVTVGAAADVSKLTPILDAKTRKDNVLTSRYGGDDKDPLLQDLKLSGPTNEANPRCEFVAKNVSTGKRVHVLTVNRNRDGRKFASAAKKFKAFYVNVEGADPKKPEEPRGWTAKAQRSSKSATPAIEDGHAGDAATELDVSPNTRQQRCVFEGMLPTLSKEVRDKWEELSSKKGVKGIQQLKNALRNSVVHKDATYELSTSNLRDVKATDFLNVTKTVTQSRSETGMTHSALEAKFHFNGAKLQAAKDRGDVWHETDSDGDEMWYEKKKIRSVTDAVEKKSEFKKDHSMKDMAELKQMIQDSCATNKAWLQKAIGRGKKGSGPSSSRAAPSTKGVVTYETMQVMQGAWDASTQLTADAGLLAQRIKRDRTESQINHERADNVMQLLKDCVQPSSVLLANLGKPMTSLDLTECEDNLKECAKLFLLLEQAHQELIMSSGLSKKDKKKTSARLAEIKN
ncbi:unnamed protein product, partial [Prorocentrum cordatum]